MNDSPNNSLDSSNAMSLYREKILQALSEEFPKVDHIILYGSYGRNEGAWFKSAGVLTPYNDFDLLLIFEKSSDIPRQKNLQAFRKQLALNLGIQWVDLSLVTKHDLSKVRNSIYGYDLKYGSTVIYGDSSILDTISEKSSESISLVEGEILFFTRLWTFCGSTAKITSLENNEARFFRNQMAKAVLAAVDSILLREKSYHHSYARRQKKVLGLEQISPEDKVLINWAFAQKESPTDNFMTEEDTERTYISVADFYKRHMLKLLSIHHNRQFSSILEFKEFYRSNFKVNLKRFLYIILKRSRRFEKVYRTNIVQMNILSKVLDEQGSKELLFESQFHLRKIGIQASLSMNDIKSRVARARETI